MESTTCLNKRKLRAVRMFCVLVLCSSMAMAAAGPNGNSALRRADKAFAAQNYTQAADLYRQVLQLQPEGLEVNYKLGVCYLQLQQPDRAKLHLEKVYHANAGYTATLTLYLAQANHLTYNFNEAKKYYQQELHKASRLDTRYLVSLQKRLDECAAGLALTAAAPTAVLSNLGPAINTRYADYVPVPFAADSAMLYTTRKPPARKYQQEVEQVKIAREKEGVWQPSELYLKQHKPLLYHAVVSVSADGTELFTRMSGKLGGLFSTKKTAAGWGEPALLGRPFNKGEEELAVHVTDDGRFAVFSSNRAGGFGGLDLYLCQRLPDGSWSEAVNLGPQVNTIHDEDAPFVHTGSNTLFFSSRGHNSMGGFDVFRSVLAQGVWTQAENMGMPVNSPADDLYFSLNPGKTRGYLSSDRAGGLGSKDIYRLIFY